MNLKIKNYLVIGDEVYNKTKLPVIEQCTQRIDTAIIEITTSEKIEKWVYEFEEIFRHNYVETSRYVGK